jgi:hypothetical protein
MPSGAELTTAKALRVINVRTRVSVSFFTIGFSSYGFNEGSSNQLWSMRALGRSQSNS